MLCFHHFLDYVQETQKRQRIELFEKIGGKLRDRYIAEEPKHTSIFTSGL